LEKRRTKKKQLGGPRELHIELIRTLEANGYGVWKSHILKKWETTRIGEQWS